jgi:hypothetical protein
MEPEERAARGALHPMSGDEAERWIRAAGGRLVAQGRDSEGRPRWAAYVPAPGAPGARSRLIVGLGDSRAAAAQMAEAVWHEIWASLGRAH